MKTLVEKMTSSLKLSLVFILFILSGCVSEEARPYDRQKNCWGEWEVVDTSLSLGGSSVGSMTYATDDSGDLWLFSSSGFKETENLNESIMFAPPCDET